MITSGTMIIAIGSDSFDQHNSLTLWMRSIIMIKTVTTNCYIIIVPLVIIGFDTLILDLRDDDHMVPTGRSRQRHGNRSERGLSMPLPLAVLNPRDVCVTYREQAEYRCGCGSSAHFFESCCA